MADYYWGALTDYVDGRFTNPARQIQQVSLKEANAAMREMFGKPGYVRVERPLLSYDQLYELAWAALAGLLALLLVIAFWRRRRRAAKR